MRREAAPKSTEAHAVFARKRATEGPREGAGSKKELREGEAEGLCWKDMV
jgi:hypothetical protein